MIIWLLFAIQIIQKIVGIVFDYLMIIQWLYDDHLKIIWWLWVIICIIIWWLFCNYLIDYLFDYLIKFMIIWKYWYHYLMIFFNYLTGFLYLIWLFESHAGCRAGWFASFNYTRSSSGTQLVINYYLLGWASIDPLVNTLPWFFCHQVSQL